MYARQSSHCWAGCHFLLLTTYFSFLSKSFELRGWNPRICLSFNVSFWPSVCKIKANQSSVGTWGLLFFFSVDDSEAMVEPKLYSNRSQTSQFLQGSNPTSGVENGDGDWWRLLLLLGGLPPQIALIPLEREYDKLCTAFLVMQLSRLPLYCCISY